MIKKGIIYRRMVFYPVTRDGLAFCEGFIAVNPKITHQIKTTSGRKKLKSIIL